MIEAEQAEWKAKVDKAERYAEDREHQVMALKAKLERTKTEHDGVDVDALLKLADHFDYAFGATDWAKTIRNAVKGANASKPMPLPEGVIWPTYEDGELVKFGDKLGREIGSIEFYGDFVTMRAKDGTNIQTDTYGTRYERPEPEVLDADGVPIKVGDTVWDSNGESHKVVEINVVDDDEQLIWCGRYLHGMKIFHIANEVTHRKPDTQEAIEEDALSLASKYDGYECVNAELLTDEILALLERQRKLIGGE